VILGLLGAWLSIRIAIPWLVGLIVNLVTLDAATITIEAALWAASSAIFGLIGLIFLGPILGYATYYLIATIQRDCAGT
jgi:hypothetical protein